MTSEEAVAANRPHSEIDLLWLLVEKETRSWGIWSLSLNCSSSAPPFR